jgi:hypothetical protein
MHVRTGPSTKSSQVATAAPKLQDWTWSGVHNEGHEENTGPLTGLQGESQDQLESGIYRQRRRRFFHREKSTICNEAAAKDDHRRAPTERRSYIQGEAEHQRVVNAKT